MDSWEEDIMDVQNVAKHNDGVIISLVRNRLFLKISTFSAVKKQNRPERSYGNAIEPSRPSL
jgi:hypothetical protein